jgi:hypothetical protein
MLLHVVGDPKRTGAKAIEGCIYVQPTRLYFFLISLMVLQLVVERLLCSP